MSIERLIGQNSTVARLGTAASESMASVRRIAHRVAVADARREGRVEFADALADAQGIDPQEEIDLETEMVALAEEQLHSETTMAVMSKLYDQIRSGIREG